MIVAAVEDLLFSSKIRTVGKQVGAELTFARTAHDVLEKVRADRPTLVLFDLNSAKTDPIATIAAIRADRELADVRIVGFASHVDAELIRSAQAAGADEVLPRSAFASRLPAILASNPESGTSS